MEVQANGGRTCRLFVFTRPTGLLLRRKDLPQAWTAARADVGIEGVRPPTSGTMLARNPNLNLAPAHRNDLLFAARRFQRATAERHKEADAYLDV
jgi:hypothetical protein